MNSHFIILILIASLVPLSAAYISQIWSYFGEVCDKKWVPVDMQKFRNTFQERVVGQPLVEDTIFRAVSAHFRKEQPEKALVLSFHGWPGTGKNFVASHLVNSIFLRGSESSFYKHYNARIDFTRENQVHMYHEKLVAEVTEVLKRCGRAVFVFDEVDMMPPKVIDALHPFIDYQKSVNGVDPRGAIFIFLSNRGGRDIADITFELWKKNKDRKDFRNIDFADVLTRAAYNEKGGLQHSDTINSFLLNYFVAFLPLQLEHVKKCIDFELVSRKEHLSDLNKVVQEVLEQVAFTKKDSPSGGIFAVSGCKNIDSIVSTVIEKHYYYNSDKSEF